MDGSVFRVVELEAVAFGVLDGDFFEGGSLVLYV